VKGKMLVTLLVVAVGFMLAGCATNVDEAFYGAASAYHDAVNAEYREYVAEDAELTQDQKLLRYASTDAFTEVLEAYEPNVGLE